MRETWEMKYGELRQKLKENYRRKTMNKKLKDQGKGIIPTTENSSLNNSVSFRRVVSVDHNFMVEEIRESRDYSFLLSDEPLKPNPKPSNSTSRKTSNNVVVPGVGESKKPISSIKIRVNYNKIAPKEGNNVGSIRKPYSENLECKKPNLEPKKEKLQPLKRLRRHRYESDDEKSDEEEAEKALRMIRRMYKTERFAGRDDRDRDMETNYSDLLKEERKSEKVARAEDRQQLRLIMEEERREKSKKCKN